MHRKNDAMLENSKYILLCAVHKVGKYSILGSLVPIFELEYLINKILIKFPVSLYADTHIYINIQ